MKPSYIAIAAFVASVLFTSQFSGATQTQRPAFAFQGRVYGDQALGTFKIPPLPDGDDSSAYVLRVRYTLDGQVVSGGQNRSSVSHPGIPYAPPAVWDGAQIKLRFEPADLPLGQSPPGIYFAGWAWTSQAITNWGPTAPATPAQYLDTDTWESAYAAGDQTVYWGPGSSSPPGPFQYDDLSPSWIPGTAPGTEVAVVLDIDWQVSHWPDGHAWPMTHFFDVASISISPVWVKRP